MHVDQLKKEELKAKRASLESLFFIQLKAMKLDSGFVREYLFHPTRKWRIDYALVEHKLAIELEGGTWVNGGHNRGKIYSDNCEKYNELAKDGWTLFRFTTDLIKSGKAILFVEDFLKLKKAEGLI